MGLKEKIQENLNSSLKDREDLEVSVLRGVLACIQNKEKEKKYQTKKEEALTEEEVLAVVFSEAKKREEAIREFDKGNRKDLTEKEERELQILKRYLPEPLSKEEINAIIEKAIQETGAKTIQEMGKVMARVMAQVKQRARGDEVGRMVKEQLCR